MLTFDGFAVKPLNENKKNFLIEIEIMKMSNFGKNATQIKPAINNVHKIRKSFQNLKFMLNMDVHGRKIESKLKKLKLKLKNFLINRKI